LSWTLLAGAQSQLTIERGRMTEQAWTPPPPPDRDGEVVATDPRVDATHQEGVTPVPANPPPPVGWQYVPDADTDAVGAAFAVEVQAARSKYPMGSFVQRRMGDRVLAVHLEWHDFQGATGRHGCFRGAALMRQLYFLLDNRTFRDLTLVGQPTAPMPATIPVGKNARIPVSAESGAATYFYGNVMYTVTVSWSTPRGASRPKLEAKPPATTPDGLIYLALLEDPVLGAYGHPALVAEVDEKSAERDESASDQQRESEGRDGIPLLPSDKAREAERKRPGPLLGAVHVCLTVTVRIQNKAGEELALVATNAALEAMFTDASPADITPPPVIEDQATSEFTAHTWPNGFAKYAITGSNWMSSWVQVSWGAGGVQVAVQSMRGQSPFLKVTSTLLKRSDTTYVVVIERAPTRVPVAPIVCTARDVYQTRNAEKKFYTVGHAHTKDRMVLGVDMSSAQTMDFKALTDFVDTNGRRVWFVCVKAFQWVEDSKFAEHWAKASQTRLLRMPYVFLDSLDEKKSKNASNATLQALADERFDKFKNSYMKAGGWRHYDLPGMVDFEPNTSGVDLKGNPIPIEVQLRNAWTLLPVMRTFIRRMTAMFGTAPFFYSGSSFFPNWYPLAKRGMAQERPDLTWDDAWLDPVFGCRLWHSEYPDSTSPTQDPSPRNWPWPKPRGYTGRWFPGDARWDIYQFGLAHARNTLVIRGADPPPQGEEARDPSWGRSREADAESFGTINPSSNPNVQLDLDVWKGSLPELVNVALQTRFDPRA
jgi:hypothetical protein